MALVELEQFKYYIAAGGNVPAADDEMLQAILDAAHSAVFAHLGRTVEGAASVATERLFMPLTRWVVETDDFTELVTVSDNGTDVTDGYQLEPVGGRGQSGDYRPYNVIRRTAGAWTSNAWSTSTNPLLRPVGEATIAVTAKWGWATIPAAVRQAVLMVGKDIRAARDVNYGIAAFTDFGAAVRIRDNPQVEFLLRPFVRWGSKVLLA